jgi:uncharacterized protein
MAMPKMWWFPLVPVKKRGWLVVAGTYLMVLLIGLAIGGSLDSHEKEEEKLQPIFMATPLAAEANIVAVRNDGLGSLGSMRVEIQDGGGRVLFNTNPFSIPDIQYSVQKAVLVAQRITKMDLTGKDIIVTFDVEGNLVGGESAGAAITSAIIGAINGKSVRGDVVITGTIDPDGTIGAVSGIAEKMQAAADGGVKVFLIPSGQRNLVYYVPVTKTEEISPGFFYKKSYYVRKSLDLIDLGQELGLKVMEVSSINEAVPILLG